jgi:glyoxylase-like metal-dependent hydrolase (beta-lactamase superfamily II)
MTKSWMALALTAAAMLVNPARAVEVRFQSVAPGVCAHVGDTGGRSYENEGLNAKIGLVVTKNGALLIDPGATFLSVRQIAEAASKITPQPIKWVLNTGGQDHRWLGNGYFKAHGAEIIVHADAETDMKASAREHLGGLKTVLKERLDGTEPV